MKRAGTMGIAVVVALLALTLASPVHAQTFSSADLEGTWEVFQLATPQGTLTGADVRTYRGEVTFDATGLVTGISFVTDNVVVPGPNTFSAAGMFAVSNAGVVAGTLTLTNTAPPGPDVPSAGMLVVREARLLANRHTIIGAANVSVTGEASRVGLFTFSKREDGQAFTVADLGADTGRDWNYHELTPSNQAASPVDESAAWVSGSITFHGTDSNPGCTEADLALSDGTVVAQRNGNPTSFG
jgi:hypothetical protein